MFIQILISLLIPIKKNNSDEILIVIASNLISLGRIAILIVLNTSIHKHGMFLHLGINIYICLIPILLYLGSSRYGSVGHNCFCFQP